MKSTLDDSPISPNPLTDLTPQMVTEHWRAMRPAMVQELEAAQQLETAVQTAIALTEEDVLSLVAATGCTLLEAWMNVRERYVILPSEEDVPALGSPPQNWRMPEADQE